MEKLAEAIVYIFIDEVNNKVLLEQRPAKDEYPEEWIFPGGKKEDADRAMIDCLLREAREELGVTPRWFSELPQTETTLSPLGRSLYPYVVTDWGIQSLPEKTLDRGHCLQWEELDNVLLSPIPSVRKLAEDLKSYLQQ